MVQTNEQYEFVHQALSLYERELPDRPPSGDWHNCMEMFKRWDNVFQDTFFNSKINPAMEEFT